MTCTQAQASATLVVYIMPLFVLSLSYIGEANVGLKNSYALRLRAYNTYRPAFQRVHPCKQWLHMHLC